VAKPNTTKADRCRLAPIVVPRYLAGESMRQIADSLDRSYTTVRLILLEANVKIRPASHGRRLRHASTTAPS
jgi:hypothetical protein